MRDIMQMNRAKMNYLQILWDDTVAKLTYQYASKNKKKEFTQFIAQLNSIKVKDRDRLLTRYLSRCKIANALAFFQWRCIVLDEGEKRDRNRKIFYQRIDFLTKGLDGAIKRRKQFDRAASSEETKHAQQQAVINQNKRASLFERKDLSTTPELIEMPKVQKVDQSLFSSMQIETKHKIHSFETIGWADPEEFKTGKASKWLKNLTHNKYMFDMESF